VLLVDDDTFFCELAARHLELGAELAVVRSLAEARACMAAAPPDLLVVDQQLPDGSGLELVGELQRVNDGAKAIVVTGFPSLDGAVQALKDGVYDYLTKPLDLEELRRAITNALRRIELERVEQVVRYRRAADEKTLALVGISEAWNRVVAFADQAAATDAPVLITGESGSGKNLLARAIHCRGARRNEPYLSINCGALPESLVEAELFGVERGAYTGANATRKGLFELADGGTLLLDEIGEMTVSSQAKLLGVLEDGLVRRLGGAQLRRTDVRILAATNLVPEAAIAERRFRHDLFYRLAVLRIEMPPLAARLEDLPALCGYLLQQLAPGRAIGLAGGEMEALGAYHWPGNVRELRNVLERALLVQRTELLRPSALLDRACRTAAVRPAARAAGEPDLRTLAAVENEHILRVFTAAGGNLTHAALLLGVSLSTLRARLRTLGVPPASARRIPAVAGDHSPVFGGPPRQRPGDLL
jgi:DNA-binding NtrC family response regulator